MFTRFFALYGRGVILLNWKYGTVFRTLGKVMTGGESSRTSGKQTKGRRLALESLEQRQLLSAVPWQTDVDAPTVCVAQPTELLNETETVDYCSFGEMAVTLNEDVPAGNALAAAAALDDWQDSSRDEETPSRCGCGCGCEPQDWYNVSISASTNPIAEGGTRNINFSRDNTTDSLTVYFYCYYTSYYDYEARYGVDYSLSQTGSVTFADGNAMTSITLSTIDDSYIENDETLYIYLMQPSSGSSNYSIVSSNSSVSLTIEDNDEWQVNVTPSISQIEESAGYGCGCGCGSGDPQYGEFTLTRTGQTDPAGCTPGTTAFFQLSGTATLGNDYNISRENYYDSLGYGTNGVYSVDFPTTGSVKIRVNPYNNGTQESDETVQLTLLTPEAAAEILFPDSGCGCGCGCGGYDDHPYKYTIGSSSSGTVTIQDDDWWKVGVTTTDATATERIYDVVQDYGEFTFTREHEHPTNSTVDGDTTYGVTVEFDMIYDTANVNSATNSAAMPGQDYVLQYQSYDSWYSANQMSSTTVGTETRYHYSVTINSGETELKVRLNPNFDWDDEGVLFNFSQTTQTPGDDHGENAKLEVTNVTWWDKLDTYDAQNPNNGTAQIEIRDGAIAMVVTDVTNDGTITSADFVDVPSVGTLLVKDSTEKAYYYAWVDVIGNYVFDLEFTGQGGVEYISAYCNNDGCVSMGTDWVTLDGSRTNNQVSGYATMKGTSNSPDIYSGRSTLTVDYHSGGGGWASGTSDWARMTVFDVQVDMAFNHNRGNNTGTDGINIRNDGNNNSERHAPELQMNSPGTGESWTSLNGSIGNKEVLYIADKNVTVYTRFKTSLGIPGGIALDLQAVAPNLSIEGLGVETVTFDANGISVGTTIAGVNGFVEFTADESTASAVSKEVSTFDWNVTKIKTKTTGTGKALTTDAVTFYTVLDVPNDPWDTSDTTSLSNYPYAATDNKMQPWVTVLETLTSAEWCGGDTEVEQVAETVTTNLYEGGKFRYEPSGPQVYLVSSNPSYFNLSAFHNQITHPNPSVTTVGCADMAWGVRVLGNLLGDNLNVMILSGTTPISPSTTLLRTRSILPIGETDPVSKDWEYHAVAWRGTITSGTVYDACLKVYDPVADTWVLPTNMLFTNYESLLAVSSVNKVGFYNNLSTSFDPIQRLD